MTHHHLNPRYYEHPDFSMRVIEKMSLNAFEYHNKHISDLLGVPLKLQINIPDNSQSSGYATSQFPIQEFGAEYNGLGVVLVNHVYPTFRQILFKTADFPVGFARDTRPMTDTIAPNTSQFATALVNSQFFSVLPYLVDYGVERFLSHGVAQTLLPIHYKPFQEYNLYEDIPLQSFFKELIAINKMSEINIVINSEVESYQQIIHNLDIGNGADYSLKADAFKYTRDNNLEMWNVLELLSAYKDDYNNLSIVNVQDIGTQSNKPMFSADVRIKMFEGQAHTREAVAHSEKSAPASMDINNW